MSEAQPSLYLAVCAGDLIHVDTVVCLVNLFRTTPLHAMFHRGSMVPKQRQKAAEHFLAGTWSHLLFIDSDMTFPPDVASRLLSHDMPVVACNYRKRTPPHDYVTTFLEEPQPDDTFVEVMSLATGMMLIRRSVFSALHKPYFQYPWDGESHNTEDTYFSSLCYAAHIPLYCDMQLSKEIKHLATIPI